MIEVKLEEIDTGAVSFGVSFLDIAEHFSSHSHLALLETRGAAGYCFLAFRPFLTGDFRIVEQALATWRFRDAAAGHRPPFLGGGIGYFSYDFGRRFEKIPERAIDELGLPDCHFCFYNAVFILDPGSRIFLSSFDPGVAGAVTREEVLAELARVTPGRYAANRIAPLAAAVTAGWGRETYLQAVRRVQEHILAATCTR